VVNPAHVYQAYPDRRAAERAGQTVFTRFTLGLV
jgi:hypothetical protein